MAQNRKKHANLRVPYALAVFGDAERKAVMDVLKTPMIVPGKQAKEFEGKIARLFGKKHGVLVNSGSSANLLAFELLNLPKGSEVITPVLTFGTTLAPILQKGLVPVFADVMLGDYGIDIDQLESLITKKTKALMIPSLMGNIPDLRRLRAIANKHKLFLIEDSCDTLGAKLYSRPTGVYSDISTTSFYAAHIITAAGTGGMICVNNKIWYQRAKILTGWGRSSAVNESEKAKKRFGGSVDGIPYDGKFIFEEAGYNFQSTEISAAFALQQMKRFQKFYRARNRNFKLLLNFFKKYEDFFVLPEQNPNANTAWLAFPLMLRPGVAFKRLDLAKFLEGKNIQTRPLFTGNALRQPAFRKIKCRRRKGGYPNADKIMAGSILIGCHQGLNQKQINHLKSAFDEFMENNT